MDFLMQFLIKKAFASVTTTIALPNPLHATSTIEILNNIIGAIQIYIAPPIAAIMVLIGAFQILFAGGNPDKFETGKKTILYTVIGYAIVLIACGITGLIADLLH